MSRCMKDFRPIKDVCQGHKDPLKGYMPILLLPPSKLSGILSEVRKAIQTSNKEYDLVL